MEILNIAAASWFLSCRRRWGFVSILFCDLQPLWLQRNKDKSQFHDPSIEQVVGYTCFFTSAFVSLSVSLCLMSLAIDMKTCSTFRFVFALCKQQFPNTLFSSKRKRRQKHIIIMCFFSAHRLEEFDSILISQGLSLWCWDSLLEEHAALVYTSKCKKR